MLFRNRIKYTKQMFLEIYRFELKRILLVLRILTGVGTATALVLFVRNAVKTFIRPGDCINLALSAALFLISFLLPNFMARSQMKKCKKSGLLGERVLRFTDRVLTMTYEKEGRSIDIPLDSMIGINEFEHYFRLKIDGKSTFLAKEGFELGDAASFLAWAKERIEENLKAMEEAEEDEEYLEEEIPALEDQTDDGLTEEETNEEMEDSDENPDLESDR
ncbi:MAG: hypothetical protein SOT28_04065 [Fusicatenibacter sp.]|nr:hypothetical protein [Lachnospiraceae bacterium]MDY2937477.1 hypothetical protein [Fusicatenibacter sp.]